MFVVNNTRELKRIIWIYNLYMAVETLALEYKKSNRSFAFFCHKEATDILDFCLRFLWKGKKKYS